MDVAHIHLDVMLKFEMTLGGIVGELLIVKINHLNYYSLVIKLH